MSDMGSLQELRQSRINSEQPLVAFDFDGTLADSEPLITRSLVHALRTNGHEVTEERVGYLALFFMSWRNRDWRLGAVADERRWAAGVTWDTIDAIKARNVVTFHASHKLKGQVQGDAPAGDDFE